MLKEFPLSEEKTTHSMRFYGGGTSSIEGSIEGSKIGGGR
jgi:hypothetical protein